MHLKMLSVLLLLMPVSFCATNIDMGDYVAPTYGATPLAITAGPDGAMWFTEQFGKIGRLTPAGAFTEFPVDTSYGIPNWIAGGPDGALWFSLLSGLNGSYLGRITTAGVITYFSLGVAYYGWDPSGITAGPDGAIWFTVAADGSNTVGRMTTAGAVTIFPVGSAANTQITTGPDGALWFCASTKIGRITTSGAFTWYAVPTPNSGITDIARGSDGALWFTEKNANQIGRITTAGAVTEYPIPSANSMPFGIAGGPDGALWFTESGTGILGRITTSGSFSEYLMPNCSCFPHGIATGPDGELWFADQTGLFNDVGRIVEAVFANATLTANPASGYFRSQITFAGSGYTPGETVQIYTGGVGSAVLGGATADSSGTFSVTRGAPASPFGSRIFLGVGQTSRSLGAAGFSMSAHLYLNPVSGPPGTTVTVTGFGFEPFAGGPGVYWATPRTLLGSAPEVDQSGAIHPFTIVVPAGAPPGLNQIYVVIGSPKPSGFGSFTVVE